MSWKSPFIDSGKNGAIMNCAIMFLNDASNSSVRLFLFRILFPNTPVSASIFKTVCGEIHNDSLKAGKISEVFNSENRKLLSFRKCSIVFGNAPSTSLTVDCFRSGVKEWLLSCKGNMEIFCL